MEKITDELPRDREWVLLKGFSKIFDSIFVLGYRIKKENRFVTGPSGWDATFTHYEELK